MGLMTQPDSGSKGGSLSLCCTSGDHQGRCGKQLDGQHLGLQQWLPICGVLKLCGKILKAVSLFSLATPKEC